MASIEYDIISIMMDFDEEGWVPEEGEYYSVYASGGNTRFYQYCDNHWIYMHTLLPSGDKIDELDRDTPLEDDVDDYDDY
jgi:hypothetical protein